MSQVQRPDGSDPLNTEPCAHSSTIQSGQPIVNRTPTQHIRNIGAAHHDRHSSLAFNSVARSRLTQALHAQANTTLLVDLENLDLDEVAYR